VWLIIQEQTPVVLGQTGTVFLAVFSFLLAVLNAVQFYKAKNIERLNQALHTTETEMNVYRQRAERQTKELAEANQKIGELAAKTDLSAVFTMLAETITLTRESVDLSRKFDRENTQTNISIANLLQKHGESDKEIFSSIDESLKNTVGTLKELKAEIQDHRKDARQMAETVVKTIKRQPHERTRQGDT
jgi:predicted  nucleic acid-binding Zn-ribbon protein